MSLALFTKNNWHKNGIWWWSKLFNRVIGEERYDYIRVQRRINSAKFYYVRQQLLHDLFVNYPEYAALFGVNPKTDQSHGFGNPLTYEMYRDFQENSINQDGWFGMWILYIAFLYLIHFFYSYMIPFYWVSSMPRNSGTVRLRMRDCIGSTVMEELWGNQFMEMTFSPHDFAYQRTRGIQGYSHPDDPRVMHMSTFNRKHKYKEHYIERVGDSNHMMSDRGD